MSKEIKMKFGLIPQNMGDMLNVYIPRDLFDYEVKHVNNIYHSQTTGIGSYLGDYFIEESKLQLKDRLKETAKKVKYFTGKSDVRIWSTGFMYYNNEVEVPIRKENEMKISSVRGELSKKRLEKAFGKKLDITTGDGGLLANELVGEVEKKYSVGIIPHFREKNEGIFHKAKDFYGNSVLIDLGEDPYEVVRKIGECDYIISSSLHGLIVADSFNVPNIRVTKTNKMFGDGFKFDDYYSSFGVKSKKIHLNTENDFPKLDWISDNYEITREMVDTKKEEIRIAFKKFIE
ncbi:polysaccharide pyruvyl transferase family protein [Enterococcus casseliflavus]|uniref:polysaccharide pyruvyl transferase family protein n=1 Tax=Enterococcus casseliflavus TaxID=37734 RepID=UPI0039A570F1